MGYAHSIEARLDGVLVGGLYGVAMGGVFFGESMFSAVRDASKAALVYLVALLRLSGFRLLDTQFVTPHLAQFGAVELPRADYKNHLAAALEAPALWHEPLQDAVAAEIRRLAEDALKGLGLSRRPAIARDGLRAREAGGSAYP